MKYSSIYYCQKNASEEKLILCLSYGFCSPIVYAQMETIPGISVFVWFYLFFVPKCFNPSATATWNSRQSGWLREWPFCLAEYLTKSALNDMSAGKTRPCCPSITSQHVLSIDFCQSELRQWTGRSVTGRSRWTPRVSSVTYPAK